MSSNVNSFLLGVVSTATAVYVLRRFLFPVNQTTKLSNFNSICDEGDDGCQSLFYDLTPGKDGVGFPHVKTTKRKTVEMLRTVHPEYARLPFDLYKRVVESLPLVCVDVICRRQDGKLLLFYRRDKPAANIWWWPGGRLFRGETFYDAAIRKIRDETGQKEAPVTPVAIVTVWNTFFPDSHWDAERSAGKEGTQTVNIVVLCDVLWSGDDNDKVVGNNSDWAVEAHLWITPEEAIAEGAFDKYVSSNVKLAMKMGLL